MPGSGLLRRRKLSVDREDEQRGHDQGEDLTGEPEKAQESESENDSVLFCQPCVRLGHGKQHHQLVQKPRIQAWPEQVAALLQEP